MAVSVRGMAVEEAWEQCNGTESKSKQDNKE